MRHTAVSMVQASHDDFNWRYKESRTGISEIGTTNLYLERRADSHLCPSRRKTILSTEQKKRFSLDFHLFCRQQQ